MPARALPDRPGARRRRAPGLPGAEPTGIYEIIFSSPPPWAPAVVTLAILAAAIFSFVCEKVPPDLTSLPALLALLLTGVLTAGEAFSGFSHSATFGGMCTLPDREGRLPDQPDDLRAGGYRFRDFVRMASRSTCRSRGSRSD